MMNKITIMNLTALFRKELEAIYDINEIDSIRVIAIEYITGYNRTQQLLNKEATLSNSQIQNLEKVLKRLKNHEPIQYILGYTEFYELPFTVKSGVLIPRQETELLVDTIIKEQKTPPLRILDIGTGSGCIAISLKKHIPEANLVAIDISEKALNIARKNAELNKTEISFYCADIFNPNLDLGKFDLIVSNPPYVMEKEKEYMEQNVLAYEPHLALFVPNIDPLKYYKRISSFAKENLNTNGSLWTEINEALGMDTKDVFQENGFNAIKLFNDLNGKDRFIKATYL